MKKELIEKKGLVTDQTKVMVFYYKEDGKRTCVTGLFRELTKDSITIINKYQLVTFKLEKVVGVTVLESRRHKEVR